MAETVRHKVDYSKKPREWFDRLKKQPPYPIPALNRKSLYWVNRPVLDWKDPHPEELRRDSIRAFITGHAVDHGGGDPRFPDNWENIVTAWDRIKGALDGIYAEAINKKKPLELVFCSATTGTDLLALLWALNKMQEVEDRGEKPNISIRSFLGYDKDTFIKDSVRHEDHGQDRQDFWYGIYKRLEEWGEKHGGKSLIIEPEFRGSERQIRNPRPPADAPKGERFKDQINTEGVMRYGADSYGKSLYKHFDEMNDMMVRYLRRGDYVVALWDGSEPKGRGGTVYALDAAAKRIKNKDHIIFIDPKGIIDEKRLAKIQKENGRPVELNMSRVRAVKAQFEAKRRTQPPARS